MTAQNYKDDNYNLREGLGAVEIASAYTGFVFPFARVQIALADEFLGKENRFERDLVPDALLLQVEYGRESVVGR